MFGDPRPLTPTHAQSAIIEDTTSVIIANSPIHSTEPTDIISTCPFGGLPAAHLAIKKCRKIGHLNRIGKRKFFDQPKKYYVGILDGWILFYCGGQTDLKPTFCLQLSRCSLGTTEPTTTSVGESTGSPSKRREFTFQLIHVDKKYTLQATSANDLDEWLSAIFDLEQRQRLNTFNSMCRRLPTPPPQSVYQEERTSSRSEDIYEEPADMQTYAIPRAQSIPSSSAPDLPQKLGKRFPDLSGESTMNECDYDTPKNPPRSTTTAVPETVDKLKEVKSLLSTHLAGGGVCRPKPKSTILKKPAATVVSTDKPKKDDNRSPIKKMWFLHRLSRSVTRSPSIKIAVANEPSAEHMDRPHPIVVAATTKFSVKGGKVNMIINQLEANGHLPLFGKGMSERRYTTYCEDEEDCHNDYELVTIARDK